MNRIVLFLIAAIAPVSARAIDVFACEPEWASLVSEIAGDAAEITVATTAFQDPHRLQARPSLIAGARSADLLACSGADLEIGWLPLLLRRSGNPQIQPGNPGYFLAADYVRKLEVPSRIDRAQGDIHPQGNPHVHLHPRNIARIATALAERLAELDSSNAARYQDNLEAFLARWSEAEARWGESAGKLQGMRLVSYHLSFSYLVDWLGLDIVATLESRPGIPPSGAQLAKLLEQLSPNVPIAIIRTPYENEKPALWLSERLGIPEIALPYTTGGDDAAVDLFSLFDETLRMLAEIAP